MTFRCAHIADVHFRGLKRHDEYRAVFNAFFEKCRELKPDAIFIGGDIVHSKTQGISPEVIDILHWWFKSMAEIAPVHIVLGNHDGLILNHDRQDAITPIVNAIDSPEIHLYKNSGVYPIKDGYNWCVFSCFDEEGWKNVKPVEGDINIATFHGGVLGSKTDTEWDISGEVAASFFDDYDFTFLGDIHKFQYIDHEKRIAYPGSTIQQNYGEDVKKGFLFWEINSKWDYKSTFHQLKNLHPFITIDWKDDYDTTVSSLRNKPKGARFRVRADVALTQAEIRLIYSYLRDQKDAKEIVFKIDAQQEYSKNQSAKIKTLNLWEESQRNNIIENYFQDSLDEDSLNEVKQLFSKTIDEIPEDSVKKPTSWSLKKLNFENTFAYGKGNEINFENMNGIVGIFAKNASGKSSIPGTIMYNLFNGTDRGALKNLHVVNSRKGNCKSTAIIEANSNEYAIERKTVKKQNKNGTVSATTYLDLKRQIDGTAIDESEEQRRETEKVLRELVGTSDDFLMTSFASQGSINSFIKEKASSRKSILTKFIGLDIFEDLYKISRDHYNLLKGQLMSKKQRDWSNEIESAYSEIQEKEVLKKELKQKELQLKEKESHLRFLISQNQNTVSDFDIGTLENKCNTLKLSIKNITQEIEDLKDERDALNNQIAKISNALSKIDINALRSDKERFSEAKLKLNTLLNELSNSKKDLKNANESLKILDSVPCSSPCVKQPALDAGIDVSSCKFISRAHESVNNKDKYTDQVNVLENSASEIKSFIANLEKIQIIKKISLFDDNTLKVKSLKSKHQNLVEKIEILSERLISKNDDYKTTKEEYEAAVKMMSATDQERLVDLNKQLKSIETEINGTNVKWSKAEGRIAYLQDTILRFEEEREEFEELNEKNKTYNVFSTAMSKKGIPVTLIKDMLPVINAEIKQILTSVVPFTVELDIEDGSNSMDVYINYGDSKRIIECGSGMEKMISSIAIRVALINISSLPKSDIFIIDEGFGALDDTNLEACSRLLQSLKKWFKTILIISHVDAVKDIVDDTIEIMSKGNDAYVKY